MITFDSSTLLREKENYFIMMVGPAGAGKTAVAEELLRTFYLLQKPATIVGTDRIRAEYFGDVMDQRNNQEVFKIARQQIQRALLLDENVIFDATNLTIKNRATILQCVNEVEKQKHSCINRVAYVVAPPIETVFQQNQTRSRQVPEAVIHHQISKFQMPLYNEGFDSIEIYHLLNNDFSTYEKEKQEVDLGDILSKLNHFDQQSHWHKFDLLTHSYNTLLFFEHFYQPRRPASFNRHKAIKTAVLLHDYGKTLISQTKENGEKSYKGHANYGAFALLSLLPCLGITEKEAVLEFTYIINYHMLMFDLTNQQTKSSTVEKYRKLLGDSLYDLLVSFNLADQTASTTKYAIQACKEETI